MWQTYKSSRSRYFSGTFYDSSKNLTFSTVFDVIFSMKYFESAHTICKMQPDNLRLNKMDQRKYGGSKSSKATNKHRFDSFVLLTICNMHPRSVRIQTWTLQIWLFKTLHSGLCFKFCIIRLFDLQMDTILCSWQPKWKNTKWGLKCEHAN